MNMNKRLETVYVVSWSFFAQQSGSHNTDSKVYKNEELAKAFFEQTYNEMLEMCKKHCDKVITFWDCFKTKEEPPKEGNYIFAFDMASNDRTVSYIEDGITKISYNIKYYGQPLIED